MDGGEAAHWESTYRAMFIFIVTIVFYLFGAELSESQKKKSRWRTGFGLVHEITPLQKFLKGPKLSDHKILHVSSFAIGIEQAY